MKSGHTLISESLSLGFRNGSIAKGVAAISMFLGSRKMRSLTSPLPMAHKGRIAARTQPKFERRNLFASRYIPTLKARYCRNGPAQNIQRRGQFDISDKIARSVRKPPWTKFKPSEPFATPEICAKYVNKSAPYMYGNGAKLLRYQKAVNDPSGRRTRGSMVLKLSVQ